MFLPFLLDLSGKEEKQGKTEFPQNRVNECVALECELISSAWFPERENQIAKKQVKLEAGKEVVRSRTQQMKSKSTSMIFSLHFFFVPKISRTWRVRIQPSCHVRC